MTRCLYCRVTTSATFGLCAQCGAPLPTDAIARYLVSVEVAKYHAQMAELRRCLPGQVFAVDNPDYVVAHNYGRK